MRNKKLDSKKLNDNLFTETRIKELAKKNEIVHHVDHNKKHN